MENELKKWVYLSYLAFAAMVSFVLYTLAEKVIAQYDLEAMLKNVDIVLTGSTFAIGFLVFLFLFKSSKVNQFMGEVAVELTRVTWPTQNETTKATIVVIVMVLISGLILGSLDSFWTWVVKQIL